MDRVTRWLVAGAALVAVTAPIAAHAKGASYLRAERAGWMMGMYVGEKKDQPFPFIIQVDKAGDAYRKGLREGDELIKFNNMETAPLWHLFDEVNRLRPDREIVIWVRRGAETQRFFVRVPKDPGAPADKPEEVKKKPEGDESADAEDKKKKNKKKPPVVVKPIPSNGE